MIKNNATAELKNLIDVNPAIFEVNFDDKYKDCVRISLFEHNAIVKYTDLFSFMFTIATREQQAKMIPVSQELGTEYMKQIHVRLKKDMKEGEEVIVNVPIHVPSLIEADIRHELEKKSIESPYMDREV